MGVLRSGKRAIVNLKRKRTIIDLTVGPTAKKIISRNKELRKEATVKKDLKGMSKRQKKARKDFTKGI